MEENLKKNCNQKGSPASYDEITKIELTIYQNNTKQF